MNIMIKVLIFLIVSVSVVGLLELHQNPKILVEIAPCEIIAKNSKPHTEKVILFKCSTIVKTMLGTEAEQKI